MSFKSEMASLILEAKWEELDEFARLIVHISVDDDGVANDENLIAKSLIEIARADLKSEAS